MGEAVKQKSTSYSNPDWVRQASNPTVYNVGQEWRCPECGTVFLVTTDKWGYVYKGRKYCRYNCLRAVEGRDEK